jgi:alpha-galactosidase
MTFKVAFIGAGSIGFTRTLLTDLLSVPEFRDIEVAFTDINAHNLDMVRQLCQRDIDQNGLKIQVQATTDRREALRGAKYVVCCVRVGGIEAFQTDIDVPLTYGLDQCVGDTLCAGGIMYGQRGIAAILDFCKDIREVAAPGAIMLNYANPMAQMTWAANVYGGVFTIGLCHGVQGGHHQIADCATYWARRQGLIGAEEKVEPKDVDIVCAGINHQTWYVKAVWRGIDLTPRMLELFEGHPDYPKTEKVRIDMLRRFGHYSTESNGHLSEYVPWYRKRPEQIKDWIDLGCWINGETGGYLRVCTEGRNWFETDFPQWLAAAPPAVGPGNKRSEEHGSFIIEARETGRTYRGHFNVVNRGRITNLPADCVVEIPGYVDRTGLHTPVVGDLPLGCAASCSASVSVQRMSVEAAVKGDVNLLKLAMLHDPLVGAVCNPEEVWQMTDELLVAQAQWLPQYAAEIPAAAARLAEAARNGMRVKTRAWQGAARLHVKTVEEMAANAATARANAAAADKGKMTKEE